MSQIISGFWRHWVHCEHLSLLANRFGGGNWHCLFCDYSLQENSGFVKLFAGAFPTLLPWGLRRRWRRWHLRQRRLQNNNW